ncbi:CRISPR-associated endonuclease Cas1 [Marinithermus hydrothermalis]|uniref:CRISPR-associated endonuclease Cas1 n=1 Tax=Marinithermus hydrothermalis TaxID=186192 RepID=UPI0002EDDA3A
MEGIATRTYFEGLASGLGPYGFGGRSRRPPRDAPNAALSYGYALLLARAWLAVVLAGLHPEVGFLHVEGRRNPALALDLMEEFRVPVVDVTVLRAFQEGVLDPAQHFEARGGGVYLNEGGRKRLVRVLAHRLNQEVRHPDGSKRTTYAGMIAYQGVRLAAAVEGRRAYHPFFLEASR